MKGDFFFIGVRGWRVGHFLTQLKLSQKVTCDDSNTVD